MDTESSFSLCDVIMCHVCGKITPKKDTISDYRLRGAEGEYFKFCLGCKDVFEKYLKMMDNPKGAVFEAGLKVDLAKKDPFFRVKLRFADGDVKWESIYPAEDDSVGEEVGGLMVFIRRATHYLSRKDEDKFHRISVPVVIKDKKDRVAFAEPFIEVKSQETLEIE